MLFHVNLKDGYSVFSVAWDSALIFHSVCLFSRFHLYMWWDIKREKWDHRKSRFSSRISQRSELYVGYCSRGEEQNSYSFSILRCGGRIWLFIFIRRTSSSCQLQNEASHVHRHSARGIRTILQSFSLACLAFISYLWVVSACTSKNIIALIIYSVLSERLLVGITQENCFTRWRFCPIL